MGYSFNGMTFESLDSPNHDCEGCYFESNDGCTEAPSCRGIVWIKSEKKEATPEKVTFSEASSSEKITFSSEQITYLQQVFQIDATQKVLPVKDGFVKKNDLVWRKYEFGPDNVKADEHWDNIRKCPDVYSVKEPKYKVVYED